MKTCSRCGLKKELSDFPKAKTCIDGTRSYCKVCDKARKDVWRSLNKDKHNLKGRLWRVSNPEKAKQTAKKYRERNKDLVKALSKNWKSKNKEKVNFYTFMRRQRVKLATPKWVSSKDFKYIFMEAKQKQLDIDHIVPLKGKLVCGLHVPENLQLLTKSENSIKGNRWWPDMPEKEERNPK